MTATTLPDVRDLRARDYQQRIEGAPSPVALDNVSVLVRDAVRMGRISRTHLLTLGDVAARRRTELAYGLVLAHSDDSGLDCKACGASMRREMGPWDDPDVDGNPIVDVQDVCPGCGARWPVTDGAWSLAEIRTRVSVVQAHRSVRDHSGCDGQQPCRVSRVGIPAVPAEAVER